MISIEEFQNCKLKGNTVGDLIDLLRKLDPSKPLYFEKVSFSGNEIKDVSTIYPTNSDWETEDGYTIVL